MRISYFLFCTLPLSARAEAVAAPDLGGGLLQMALGFGIILALLFGTLWLLKRISSPHGFQANLLRVIGSTAVGPRERVVIVEVGDRWLVLGVAPGRVSALHELPRQAAPAAPSGGDDFASRIRRGLEKRNAG